MEKTGVHRILEANPNILDVEVALSGDQANDNDFTTDDESNDGEQRHRIDFCALQNEDGKYFIRFFEARHYSYSAALFASGKLTPSVLQTLDRYRKTLEQNRENIEDAYKTVIDCANRLKGKNMLGQFLSLSNAQLQLDTEPRLVVFGYDYDQKWGKKFRGRMDKLAMYLDRTGYAKRLLRKGSADDFKEGISRTRGKSLCPPNESTVGALAAHLNVATS